MLNFVVLFSRLSLGVVSFYIIFQASMSVKLPLIIKRQIKPQPRRHTQPLQEEQEPKKIEPQQENYDDDEFEQQPSEEPPQPVQTFTALKQEEPHADQLEVSLVKQKPAKEEVHVDSRQDKIEELQRILQEKIQLVGALKENLGEKKKELKNIGEQIDKDLNKTLMNKTNKANTVNIRDIFSAPPKTNNKKLNELNEELKNVRVVIKKVKQEITKLSEGLNDPVIVLNQQKGIQFENRIKNQEEDIRHIEKEKVILSQEIARGGKQINEEEEKQKNEEIAKLQATLAELNNSQKELKANIYMIEKEDILLMEKVNFFQSREGGLGQTKKNKPTQKERLKLDEQIRQLIEQVNQTIEERNKIENEKKSNLKNLVNQIASIQSKNWDLCNKLREIDSFLLQYYEKKSKKKQVKQIKNISEKPQRDSQAVISKSVSGRIQAESIYSQTPIKTIEYENDKNKKPAETVLVQKKKNYDFSEKVSQDQINISDEFLGTKLNLNKIVLTVDEEKLYSIKVTYQVNSKDTVEGYSMGSKNLPANTRKIQINFDRQFLEIINFMHIGHGEDHCVSFFHIITTQGKQYKWGNIDKASKSDQKHIKKYEFCHFKSKLLPISSQDSESTLFCISGITLSTIYLSGK